MSGQALGPRMAEAVEELLRTPPWWPANAEPTDEQVADWLAICTPAERLERVRWWREAARLGWRCLMENHDGQLASAPQPGRGRHRA